MTRLDALRVLFATDLAHAIGTGRGGETGTSATVIVVRHRLVTDGIAAGQGTSVGAVHEYSIVYSAYPLETLARIGANGEPVATPSASYNTMCCSN